MLNKKSCLVLIVPLFLFFLGCYHPAPEVDALPERSPSATPALPDSPRGIKLPKTTAFNIHSVAITSFDYIARDMSPLVENYSEGEYATGFFIKYYLPEAFDGLSSQSDITSQGSSNKNHNSEPDWAKEIARSYASAEFNVKNARSVIADNLEVAINRYFVYCSPPLNKPSRMRFVCAMRTAIHNWEHKELADQDFLMDINVVDKALYFTLIHVPSFNAE